MNIEEHLPNPVIIIAEAGVNHNGDLSLAEKLVDVAAEAGADFVKFQTFKASNVVTSTAKKADYQTKHTSQDESQLEMIQRLELDEADHKILMARCKQKGIGFLSTPFDLESVDLLTDMGIPAFKIPSGEITNVPYLRKIGGAGRSIYLSTGMATLSEIEYAISLLEEGGVTRSQITVLHCNTQYPTPIEDVNLRAMTAISAAFQVDVGYSDHTQGIEVPIAAVALGASVIEKHFTLDKTMTGPDHVASLNPAEFMEMVQGIRRIESALGDGIKRPSASEKGNIPVVRKSLVASMLIPVGDSFTAHNVTAKRPGTGISSIHWDEILGRKATRVYQPDDLIEW